MRIHEEGHILAHEVFGHRRDADFRFEAVIRQGCLDSVGVSHMYAISTWDKETCECARQSQMTDGVKGSSRKRPRGEEEDKGKSGNALQNAFVRKRREKMGRLQRHAKTAHLVVLDLVVHLQHAFVIEGRLARQHLVHDDAQRPPVTSRPVHDALVALHHADQLRCNVLGGATGEVASCLRRCVDERGLLQYVWMRGFCFSTCLPP